MRDTPIKLLAIDASTERCSVALCNGEDVISEHCDTPKSHAQLMLPLVDKLRKSAALELGELDAIVVGLGPGSFTGIRIGISIAQGLAYGAKLPLYGSSSLEILAYGLKSEQVLSESSLIIPCLDARMSEVYWAVYDQHLIERVPAQVSAPEALADYVEGLASKQAILAGGHGWLLDPLRQISLENDACAACLPHAAHLLEIWRTKLENADLPTTNATVEPLYLRNEVSWDKRKRIRSHSPFASS